MSEKIKLYSSTVNLAFWSILAKNRIYRILNFKARYGIMKTLIIYRTYEQLLRAQAGLGRIRTSNNSKTKKVF